MSGCQKPLSLTFWTQITYQTYSTLLDHVTARSLSDPADKFTDWEYFQSLASGLISPRIQINSVEDADKAARDFTASVASAYRLSISQITLSDLNVDLRALKSLLKHKRRLRKVWQITGIQHVKRQLTGSPKPSDE
jgi:hypothetical protein